MRELVILGTAAQVPTKERNHNGYFLRWDESGFLFDPGEGTQRQMSYADVAASSITHIALTHFHGDHCLGLPGIIQRLSLDKVHHQVKSCYPASGQGFYEAMSHASLYQNLVEIEPHPIDASGLLYETETWKFSALALDHRTECYGYRLEEKNQRTLNMSSLEQRGIHLVGRQIGEFKRTGTVCLENGEILRIEDFSTARPGQTFAFVMDTRICENVYLLARGADMVVCEATFLDAEEKQASEYMHLTARQAGEIARDAGAKMLVLSHFSQRYPGTQEHLKQAREVFPNTYAARDLEKFEFPKRTRVM